MDKCNRCGEVKELIPNTVICGDCKQEIINKSIGKQYHPIEIAKKLDDLERRVNMLEKACKGGRMIDDKHVRYEALRKNGRMK